MLPEMKYVENELIPMLRERKSIQDRKVQSQLAQWRGEKGKCSLYLNVGNLDMMKYLPGYNNEEIHYDIEKMFISQLRASLGAAMADYGESVPSVRANVGCGCINTLIGGIKQTFFRDKMPWLLEHIKGEALMEYTAADITDSPEFTAGLEAMRFMKAELEGTGIEVYPMDIQGPVDMAHLWLGDDFFYEVYDNEELVHHALSLAVECIDYAFRKNLEIIAPTDHLCHYSCIALPISAPLKLSEDTSTLICEEHLKKYMEPYTSELFRRFGGGYIHYCGDNRHLLEITEKIPGSMGLNFGNPERHDFPSVLSALGDNGKFYISTGGNPAPGENILRAAHRPDGTFNIVLACGCAKADEERVYNNFLENLRTVSEGR